MRLFKGTRYWRPQWLGIAGALCLLLAVTGPVVQYRVGVGALGLMRALNGPAIFASFDPALRLGGFVSILLGGAGLWALSSLRYGIAKKIALVLAVLVFALVVAGIKIIDAYDDLTAASLIPVYFRAAPRAALGWAWFVLPLAPILFWRAANTIAEPTESEREQFIAQMPVRNVSTTLADVKNSRSQLQLFPGTSYWRSQVAALIACALLLAGVAGPLLRHRVIAPPLPIYMPPGAGFPGSEPAPNPAFLPPWPGSMGAYSATQESIVLASLLTSPQPFQKAVGYLLLLVGLSAILMLLNLRWDEMKWLAGGVSFLVVALLAHSIYHVVWNEEVAWQYTYPTYGGFAGGAVFSWAWLPLLLSPIGFWLAALWEYSPSQAEREELFAPRRSPRPASVSTPVLDPSRTSPANAASVQTPNIAGQAADVGVCAKCSAKNSTRATRCHACGVVLPWEQARLDKAAKTAETAAAIKARVAAKATVNGSTSNEMLLTGLQGTVLFLFCSAAPFLGYFVWRYLDNENSKFASVALYSSIIGVVLHALRFMLRVLAIVG